MFIARILSVFKGKSKRKARAATTRRTRGTIQGQMKGNDKQPEMKKANVENEKTDAS